MTTKEKLLALCEFDENDAILHADALGLASPIEALYLAKWQHAQTKPLILAMASHIELLEAALGQAIKDSICMCYGDDEPQAYRNPCIHCQRRLALEEALTAPGPLDALLQGDK